MAAVLAGAVGAPREVSARDPAPDLQQFKPVMDMNGFVLVYDASIQPRLRPGVAIFVNGSVHPFEVNAAGEGRQFGIVDGIVGVDITGVFGITDRIEVGGTIPVVQVPFQTVFVEHLGGTQVGYSMGDIRIEGRVQVIDPEFSPIGLAANVFLNLPTGNELAALGRGVPSGGARLIVSQRWERFHFAVNVGFGLYPPATIANLTAHHELTYALGVGVSPVVDVLDINVELDGSLTGGPAELTGVERFGDGPHSPLEFLVGVRGRLPHGFSVYGGAGKGLTVGFGSPALRVFGGISWSIQRPTDRDGDGVPDRDDVCRTEPEDRDGFEDHDGCPEPDNDSDGIFDLADECPLNPEDPDGFEDTDGCPEVDNDQDGILDVRDLCPAAPEDFDGFQDTDGCPEIDNDQDGVFDLADDCPLDPEDPDGFDDADGCPEPDNDQDGIFDLADLCPLRPETIDGVRDSDGCPDDLLAVRAGDRLLIFEPLDFDRRDRLELEATRVLEAVADLLLRHVEIAAVRIEVHTDGSLGASGLERSIRRADAIVDRLVELGVSPDRLDALGYGHLKPLGAGTSNSSGDERVEFVIP